MSRYGPPAYVTDRSGELLAAALEQASGSLLGGIERGRERKRQSRLDAQADTDRRIRLYDAGVRDGPAPSGDFTLPGLDTSADLSFPSGSELARHLSIGGASDPAGSSETLASALPTRALTTNQPRTFDPNFDAPRPTPAAGHPGAFDPNTGTFRDGKGMPKTPPVGTVRDPDRYAQIDEGHYLDRTQTPEARAETQQIHGKELERELANQEMEREVQRIMQAYQIPEARARVLAMKGGDAIDRNFNAPPTAARPTAPRPQLVRNKQGVYVPVDPTTGLGSDGKPVEGYTAPTRPGRTSTAKPTDGQMKFALVYPNAAKALEQVQQYVGQDGTISLPSTLIGKLTFGGYGLTPEQQGFQQASEILLSAILRPETGAAVSADEWKKYSKQYIPLAGDAPATVQQKLQQIALRLETMKDLAGPALEQLHTTRDAASAGSGDGKKGVPLNPWRK